MTSTTAPASSAVAGKRAGVAAAGLALAGVVIFAGNYNVPKGENGGTGPAIVTAALCAVIAVVLSTLVIPRMRNHARAEMILGILSVLSLAVFWSGITPVLAAATWTIADGNAQPSRRTATIRWVSAAAAVLAVAWTLANSHLF